VSESWEHEHRWTLMSAMYQCECGMTVTVKEPKFLPHSGAAIVDSRNVLWAEWEPKKSQPVIHRARLLP
jgi:hypothetical protein